MQLLNEDVIVALSKLDDSSVDFALLDLPYGITSCAWDSVIDLPSLWEGLNRVVKNNGAIAMFAVQPFATTLIQSNMANFQYELVWVKPNSTNPFHAKKRPLRKHELILIFYRSQPAYNPQMTEGKPYKWASKRSKGEASNLSKGNQDAINNEGTRYPTTVLQFKQERGLHPTQKPVELCRWLIRTFSNNGDVVLDPTMGSGTTGVSAILENRDFIGIEYNEGYFHIASTRIREANSKNV